MKKAQQTHLTERIANESTIGAPKTKLHRVSSMSKTSCGGKLPNVKLFSVKQPKDQNDEAFEQISSEEDTVIFSHSEFNSNSMKPKAKRESNYAEVQETVVLNQRDSRNFRQIKSQTLSSAVNQRKHIGILKFKPKKPTSRKTLLKYKGLSDLRASQLSAGNAVNQNANEQEDLNCTMKAQSHSSNQSVIEIQEEASFRHVHNIIQTPNSSQPTNAVPNKSNSIFHPVKAKDYDQSIVESSSMMSVVGINSVKAATKNEPKNQVVIESIACRNSNRKIHSILNKQQRATQKDNCNMLLTDEEVGRRTNFLLTKSGAVDALDDYFVNIETAVEPFDPSRTLEKPSLAKVVGTEKPRREQIEAREQLKLTNANLKTFSDSTLGIHLKVIDLSYNKLRKLPDEIANLSTLTDLKLDHNLISALPAQFWRLKALRELVLSHNQIHRLPDNFHWLQALEVLKLDYNRLTLVPENIGVLVCLKKLHLHDNRIAHLPRGISNLSNLIEFSTEWFLYTKPSNSKIQKNPEVLKSLRDFCQSFSFTSLPHARNTLRPNLIPVHQIELSNIRESKIAESDPSEAQSEDFVANSSSNSFRKKPNTSEENRLQLHQPTRLGTQLVQRAKLVSFVDFLLHYHKIPHSNVGQLNTPEFTAKRRSLVGQVCANLHNHLLTNILGQLPNEVQYKDVSDSAKKLGSVIDLNKRDSQNVTPACLLVMTLNITDAEAKDTAELTKKNKSPKQNSKEELKVLEEDQISSPQDLTDSSDQDSDISDTTKQAESANRKRDQMLKLLLDAKDENGDQIVSLNDDINQVPEEHTISPANRVAKGEIKQSSIVTVKQESKHGFQVNKDKTDDSQLQQHNILFWAVFRHRFRLTSDLIAFHHADCRIVNSNGASLLHILFANFDADPSSAKTLACMLIEQYEIDINLQDSDGKTALHVAIGKQQDSAIDFVLRFNCLQASLKAQFSFEIGDNHGKTALHYAIKKNNYNAFLFFLRNGLVDCFKRDLDCRIPRNNSFINTAFYRVLVKQEVVQIHRQFFQYSDTLTGQPREGAVTRFQGENLESMYKEYSQESPLATLKTRQLLSETGLINTDKNEQESPIKAYSEDWVSNNISPIHAPNISDNRVQLVQRKVIVESQTLIQNESEIDSLIVLKADSVPRMQYNLLQHIGKNDDPLETALRLYSSQNTLLHNVFSRRGIPKSNQPTATSMKSKAKDIIEPPPNQFEFTLGQPKVPMLAIQPQETVGLTEGNIEMATLTKGSFEKLLRQENRPGIKVKNGMVPQKTQDLGLTHAITEDLARQSKSPEQWSVLSKNPQFLKIQDQEDVRVEEVAVEDFGLGIKRQNFSEISILETTKLSNNKVHIDDIRQMVRDNSAGPQSPRFNEHNSQPQNQEQDQVNQRENKTSQEPSTVHASLVRSNEKQSNIYISNLNINVNYNININLPPQQINQPPQNRQLNRSPTKPQVDNQKLPSKFVAPKEEFDDTFTKQTSIMSYDDENVQASVRSIMEQHAIHNRQPQQIINKLSQPIINAVSSQASHKEGPNIFIGNMQINGDDSLETPPPPKKLVSGYGVEDTVLRDPRAHFNLGNQLQLKDLNGHTIARNEEKKSFKMEPKHAYGNEQVSGGSAKNAKQMYQSCDIQADSMDNSHLLEHKTDAAQFKKMAGRTNKVSNLEISESGESMIEENLVTSIACKPYKPTTAQEYESNSMFNRNLPADFCVQQHQNQSKSFNLDQSFRDCNLSDISNSPLSQRKQLFDEYQLGFQEHADSLKLGEIKSIEEGSIGEGNTHHQILSGYQNPRNEHQMTLASITCASEVKDGSILSTMQRLNVAAQQQKQFEIIKSQVLSQQASDDLPRRNQAADLLVNGFETVLKRDGPTGFQKLRGAPANCSGSLDKYTEQLKGNYYLQEFKLLIDKEVPDWKKQEVIYNKLAIVLPICTSRVQKQNKYASKQEMLHAAADDKKRKDCLICLKLLADILLTQQSAIHSEVLYLLSKHNIVKARDGILTSLYDQLTATLDEPTNFQSKLSSVVTYNQGAAIKEVVNARAVNETYKKLTMDKFPTVSHKLGRFLRNKKDNVPIVKPNQRPQSTQQRLGSSKPLTGKRSPVLPSTRYPQPIMPLLNRNHFSQTQAQAVLKRNEINQIKQDLVGEDDQLLTPRMTFATEAEFEQLTGEKKTIQKSLVLASQMNRLNSTSHIFKLQPVQK